MIWTKDRAQTEKVRQAVPGQSRYRISRALGFAVEALERRWMLSAITWNGGAGNWNDPTKWSTGTVPGTADDVTIGGGIVAITDGESARTITDNGGTLNITSSGTLGTVEGGTISGTVDDQGLFYGSGDPANPLVLAGTTIITSQLNNSYFRNTGQLDLEAGANVLGAKVTNDGNIAVSGAANLNSGTFTNNADGTFAFSDDGTTTGGTIFNTGIVVKNAGTGQSILGNNGLFEDLGGTVSATSGTLVIANTSFFQNTTFTASAGAAVDLDQSAANGSGSAQFSGTVTGSGAGHLIFANGTTYPGNPQTGGSTLSTFAFNFSQRFAQVTGMSFRQNNSTQLVNNGYLQFVGNSQHPAIDIDNKGTFVVSGLGSLGFGNQTGFVNDTTGTINFTSDAGAMPVGDGNGGGFTVTNKGLIEKTGGTGTSVIGDFSLDNEGGSFTVNTGTMVMQGSDTLNGGTTLDVTPAATLEFDNNAVEGNNVHASGLITGSGGGTVLFNSGTMYNEHQSGDSIPTATLNFPIGMAQVTGFSFRVSNDAQVINAGYLQFVGDSQHPAIDLDNQGTFVVSGLGSLGFGNQTGFLNDITGTLDFTSDAGALPVNDGAGGGFTVTNKGLIEKTGGTGTSVIGDFALDSEGGSFTVTTGTLVMQGSDTLNSGTTIHVSAAATLEFDNDAVEGNSINASGVITGIGAGTVLFNSGAMYNEHQTSGDSTPTATLNFPAGMAQVTGFSFEVYGGDAEIVNAGELDFTGSAQHPNEGIDNQGVIKVTGSGDLGAGSGGGFLNDTTGILDFETDAGVTAVGGGTSFTNKGLIEKTGGSGDTILGTGTNGIGYFNNGGSYDVESGTLTLANGGNNGGGFAYTVGNGTITAAPGTIFALAGQVALQGNPSITGGGTFELTGGALYGPNGGFGQDTSTPAMLDFYPGTFIVDGGNIDDNVGVVNIGTIEYAGGSSELDGIDNRGLITFDGGPLRVAGGTTNEVGGILDFTVAQQILAVGNNGNFYNAGTMIFSPGVGNTFDLSQINAENSGTIFVTSGTLNLPWLPNIYVNQPGLFPNFNGIPTGSTFVVDAGATITVATTPTFTQLNGTVILGGANATFPALSRVNILTGKFSVLSGASFVTAGNLTNSGTLSVGGTVTVTGNYTQAVPQFGTANGTPTLDFEVATNPGAAGAPAFLVTGNTSLSGNLTADYVNGAALTGGAYTVATFATASNGTFASTAGTAPFFTPSITGTQIVLNGSAFSGTGGSTPLPAVPSVSTPVTPPTNPSGAPDLTVSNVTAPTTFAPGSSQTITYSVTNTGNATASGNWQDSIFLSTDGHIDSTAILIGRTTHNGSLTAGGSYAGTLTAFMPAVAAGAYTVLVEADSRDVVTTDVRTGDVGASSTTTAVIPTLTLGTPIHGTTTASQEQVYALTLAAGTTVDLTATLAAASEANIYLAFNAIPTPSAYDQAATSTTQISASFLLNPTQGGTYYVVVYGRPDVSGSETFTLSAALQPYGPATVSPAVGIDAGAATLTVSGSEFTPGTTVNLVSGTTVIPALSVVFANSTTVYATFNLNGVAPGVYGVQTTQGTGGANATLAGAFTVDAANLSGTGSAASGPGQVQFTLSAPSYIRAGESSTLTLFYENVGGSEVTAPLFEIAGDNASFELPGETSYTDGAIDVLGTNPTGLAGYLAPGASGSITISFEQDTTGAHVTSTFKAFLLDPSTDSNWDSLKPALKPLTTSQAAWDQTYANFESLVGTTVGSYQTELANVANSLSIQDLRTTDASVYLSQIIEIAGDFGQIELRNASSDFGFGQADPYDSTLTLDSAGDAAIGYGEDLRYFAKLANGTFLNDDATDGGLLTFSGGDYTLTETDGSKTIYNANGTLNSFYDAQGEKTTVTLTNGLVTQLTNIFGGVTTLQRYASGTVYQITDPQGRVTTYGYDGDGNLGTVTNAAGTTTFTYAVPANHEVTEITNPNNTHQFFTYDSFARLNGESADGGLGNFTLTYDAVGNETSTNGNGDVTFYARGSSGDITSVRDALGNVISYTYGTSTLPTSIVDALGLGSVTKIDAAGDVTAVISPSGATIALLYDATHHPLSVTDPDGHATTFSYDATETCSPADATGHVSTNTYTAQNLLAGTTSAAGRVIHNAYDNAGQLISQTFSDGTTTSYTYDAHDNLTSATNASGTDTFTYDAADRLTKVTYADGLSLTYTYNSNGQLTQTVDQTGFATNYAYNAQGRLDLLTNAAGAMVAVYTYDTIGNVTRADFGNGTFTLYAYDADNRVNSVINYAADGTVTSSFAYTFDADGRITTLTTLAGVTTYAYNTDSELIQATLPGGRVLTWTYDAAGNRITSTDSAATTSTYTTNNLNQYTTDGTTTYIYDADGNLTSSSNSGGTTTYSYNVREELTSIAAPSGTTTFTYDALGNRIAETVNGVTTDLLIDPTQTNGLVGQFTTGGAAVSQFTYGLGLVSESTASASPDYYSFDSAGNVAGLTSSSGSLLNTYTYLPFGQTLATTGTTANPFTYEGQTGVLSVGNGNYLTRTRLYSATLGRFTQRDTLAFNGGDANLYRYANNDPLLFNDPSGTVVSVVVGTTAALQNAGVTTDSFYAIFNAGLKANIAALQDTGSGYASTLQANAGTYYNEAGELLEEGESLGGEFVSELPANAGTFLSDAGTFLVDEGVPVVFGEATTVVEGAATLSAAVPALVVGTGAAFLNRDALYHKINDAYMATFQPEPGNVLSNKALIQHILRNPLGRQLLGDITADGTPLSSISLDTLVEILNIVSQNVRQAQTQSVTSHDPNAIIGPAGYGAEGFVPLNTLLPYEIDFTNESTASAPRRSSPSPSNSATPSIGAPSNSATSASAAPPSPSPPDSNPTPPPSPSAPPSASSLP